MEPYEVVKLTEEVESTTNQVEGLSSKKRKRKSQEEVEGRPKKPRSAYLLYYFDVHQIMQQERPSQPQSEINKRISESWKRLSVAEKRYYLEKANSEKEGTDTFSLNTSKDLPGFRKILPRATSSYLVLTDDLQGGCSLADCLNPPVDGNASFPALTQEPKNAQELCLASKVDVSQMSLNNNIGKDIGEASSSITIKCGSPASRDISFSQSPVDATGSCVSMKGCEIGNSACVNSGVTIHQPQREATQVVAIFSNQNQLEPKSLAGVSTLGALMMVPMAAREEQSTEPPYKMAVKTYTRRGRGRCVNPQCSFVYVTRHKPTKCPECGCHLGGKWIPAAKKAQKKGLHVSKLVSDAKSSSSCQNTMQKEHANSSEAKPSGSKRDRQTDLKNINAVTNVEPAEGSKETPAEIYVNVQPQIRHVKKVALASQSMCNVQGRPVRPILPSSCSTGQALFQVMAVPTLNRKIPTLNNKPLTELQERFSGLKDGTLKQLGRVIQSKQDSLVTASQPVSSPSQQGMTIVSVVPFKHTNVNSFDLGLSTARGRGHCKNKFCDYVYKNRHKPSVCPKCGCELTQGKPKGPKKSVRGVDPCQPLSPSQKDIQRQSTLQLIRHSLQIPESEAELQETLALIQDLNSLQIVLLQPGEQKKDGTVETQTLVESGWPQFYESSATQCVLCKKPLYKGDQSTIAGQEECWLLTETLIQTASLQLKVCLNARCLALHSFTDLHPGLFNIGNKLLVSIDLFLKIRAKMRLGHPPTQAVRTLFDHVSNHPVHTLSPEESSQIQEFLLIGYWAFESLTLRDYNDMICGICGVAPVLEISRRYTNNVLELKNLEFTWPESSVSDEVNLDDFWLTMETEAIEQAAFPTEIPITRVDASIIAPFIPPLMRSPTVINTEKDKLMLPTQLPNGAPSILVRLIHDGELRPDKIQYLSEDELRTILERCGVSIAPGSTKNDLMSSLISMCTYVQSGLPTGPQPPQHLTAGKLCKVCPHKVVCSSKYLVRGETARDHVDLLVSSRFWPPVYVGDCARQVALCTDMQYPGMAARMWGRNQGCFSEPFEKPEFVSCAELQEKPYNDDLSTTRDNGHLHPYTKSPFRWLVHPPTLSPSHETSLPEHHSMALCKDLEHLICTVTQITGEEIVKDEKQSHQSSVNCLRTQHVLFSNPAHYYLYNRLLDFLSSRDIVNEQINQVVKVCQPGEVVIRDTLYRLGVANINLVEEEEQKSVEEEPKQGTEMMYEVVLPE
ncbi:HMG domain-containing protein 3 [Corythoichthys intestinalis]|uniref:HMG domain-containing protein 3 n=1 Tax=Corythoichthys intestinalis TaxID=161448 RepID=UPI0025A5D82B|nr:HMG domain-containing protein 3 [Corythoichthys intestinalis]XP_057705692.1 HMG domain-containing protein 3 [Corythoichthys intestinalis]XP_057705694.1 HMG domain-containing protein 3 [Corythoichthys intestinalis]